MLKVTTFLIYLTISATSYGEDQVCPADGDLYPCFCDTDYTGFSFVSCEKVSNMDHIKKVLDLCKGRNVSLEFSRNSFGSIPSNFFEGQISTSLSFHNCKIDSFGDKPFTGLENTLTSLTIYGSVDKRIKDLETLPLGHLKKLRNLFFEANDIKRLGNDWFKDGPASLQDISLQANDIEELGDTAFASLTNVKEIWLGDNRFKKVQRSMFPRPAYNLSILEISFNGIEYFPEDLFDDMPNLKTINVSGNKFTTLSEAVWGRIWNQLDEVYVGRSRLECDDKIKWIYQRTKLPSILDGNCAGYNSLRGKKLEDLTLDDFE